MDQVTEGSPIRGKKFKKDKEKGTDRRTRERRKEGEKRGIDKCQNATVVNNLNTYPFDIN